MIERINCRVEVRVREPHSEAYSIAFENLDRAWETYDRMRAHGYGVTLVDVARTECVLREWSP